MEHLFVFRKLAPRCAVALFDCLRDVDKNFEEMHEDFMETRDGGGKEWRQNVDSLSDSEYLLDGPDSAQCSLRKLQPQDKDVVKAICLESFPVQYPDYWFEEVLARNAGLIVVGGVSGELFCYGITYEGKLVAVIVAELKILSQCCNEDRDLLSETSSPVVYILTLAVRPAFRRRGFASRLLDHLLVTMVQQPPYPKAVYLHVLSTNYGAINLYKKYGFRHHTTLLNYYRINSDLKDGLTFVLYTNGARPPWSMQAFFHAFSAALCYPLRILLKLKYIFGF